MNECQTTGDFELQPGEALANASDDTLVLLAKCGGQMAFGELCRRHSSMAMRTVQRITRNREDAEDALQDSLLKAFTHLNTFDGRSSFSTWLTRIAINSALMILRKKRSHPEDSFDADSWFHLQMVDSSPNPERMFADRETEYAVRRAVRRLPPLLRGVIEIRYSRDASMEQVAVLTGISIAAAKSRMLRAKKSLRTGLGENQPPSRRT
jgi:RNA polymerase sigma factor (sigma-70 family)